MMKTSYRFRTVAIIIASFLFIGATGITLVLAPVTMINMWLVIALAVATAAAAGIVCRKIIARISGITSAVPNVLLAVLLTGTVLLGLFYSLNYFNPRSGGKKEICGIVERKYTKKAYRTRRVSRGKYVPSEPYTKYYVAEKLDNGFEYSHPVDFSEYHRITPGDSIRHTVVAGLFGVPVIYDRFF